MRYVEIELDRPRRLRYDLNALADLEERMGVGLGSLLSSEKLGLGSVRALLWSGLKWEDPGLTIPQAGVLLQNYLEAGGSLEALAKSVTEALAKSGTFGQPEPGGNGKAEAAH